MSATIQVERTLRTWRFDCMIAGQIHTAHRITAIDEEDAANIHDRDFPNHDFRYAVPAIARRRRRRVSQITPCVKIPLP